jgi:hypothetical protein
MLPFFRDGDEIVIAPVEWNEIRLGDIVTYRFEDKLPTRRVFWRRTGELRLSCDNWPHVRFNAPMNDVLGRAVARKRGDSWLYCDDPRWIRAGRRALVVFWWRYLIAAPGIAKHKLVEMLRR